MYCFERMKKGARAIAQVNWTDELERKLIDLVAEHGKEWDIVAELLHPNATYHGTRIQYGRLIKKGFPIDESEREFDEKSGLVTSKVRKRMAERREFSKDELLKLHALDPNEFKLDRITSNEWSMTNGEGIQYYNYQSKIVASPKLSTDMELEEMVAILASEVKPFEVELLGLGDTNLVIQLADLHFGVTKIDMTKEKLAKLIDRIDYGYKTIVIEQLGDLFHSSQMKSSQTLKGTLLDDVDMAQAIEDAKTFFHAIITMCLEKAERVVIEHAGGNHSDNLEYMFLNYLEAKYPQVEVNYHNDTRRAYKLGNVGIMLSHGDTVALNKLPMLFANEYKLLWADSTVCEVHTAHKHNKYVEQEIDGVVLRQAPTIKPNDFYEIRNGWTTNRKIIQVIEYDEDGEVGSYII